MHGESTVNEAAVRAWAERFALLGDLSRLNLLLTIRAAGPISVTDLAAATGLKPPTVSQALRLLRAHDIVYAHRDGRTKRYVIIDASLGSLLDQVAAPVAREPAPREPAASSHSRR